MMRQRTADPRGMSLVEVLVALTVLAIGIAGAMASVIYSSKSTTRGAHVEEASMLAQSLASALQSVPYTAQIASSVSPFANSNTGNDTDVTDTAGRFCNAGTTSSQVQCVGGAAAPTGTWAPDHTESQLSGTQIAAMVAPLPTGRTTYERYWNIAAMPGIDGGTSTNGAVFAVIVRWKEGDVWQRTVVVGTRFQP